jgi:hypothetical protein
MPNKPDDKKRMPDEKKSLKPEPGTLHKTDPQENMEGPVSSFMQNLKKAAEKNDEESKEAADKRKDENT